MGFLSNLFKAKPKVDYRALVLENGAKIIDVRTPQEFNAGHGKNAINIPLHNISSELKKIKAMNTPIIVVCRSGARSAQAKMLLQSKGVEVYNAKAWQNVADL